MAQLNLLYFAWIREKVGHGAEQRTVPDDITTVGDLISWLTSQGEEYASAFADAEAVRVAIDQTHATRDQQISGAREIAFFPPVTGG